MTRWMIGTAVLGAMTGAVYGQADTATLRAEGPQIEVTAETIVLAQAALAPAPAPAADPAAPKTVPVPPPPTPAGPALAPGVAPVAPAPPVPAKARPNALTFRAAPAKLEKVPYLGVVTSAAPAAMRDQLKLAPGTGLVVDQLEPGAAAEKAGVKQHDILERLDDQLLINPQQLAALLLSKHAGDEVTLAIVRQGERQSIKARLEEKEVDINAYRATGGGLGGGGEFMPLQAITIDPTGTARVVAGANPLRVPVETNWAFDAVPGKRVAVRTLNDGAQTTVWADDEVSISIERRGGKTANMIVKDKKTDKPIYTGTGDGLEKLLDARPELRDKVKKAQDAANRDAARLQLTPPAPGAKGAAGGGGFGGGGAFGAGGGGVAFFGGGFGGAGGKVVRWQDDNLVLLMRMAGRTPTYLLALSKKDGRTLFDGPVANEDDRRSVPAEIAEQFQMICAQPDMAQELGAADKPANPDALPRTK